MIKGTFPRLFGNFREGALLNSKFVTSGTGTAVTFALETSQGNSNYLMSLVRTGVGLYELRLGTGCRNISVVNILVGAPAARAGLQLVPQVAAFITESTGVITLRSCTASGTVTTDVIDAGDEVHCLLYVDK